jgi:MFS family permease
MALHGHQEEEGSFALRRAVQRSNARPVAWRHVAIAAVRPLRHRAFALFWAAGATSDIGTWVQLATIGSVVAASGGSTVSIGLVAAATFAPQGICSPIGGLLADRLERRRTFLTTLGVQTLVTSLLAIVVARGVHSASILSALVLVQSSAGALGGPSLQAILPELVPRSELTAAVALGLTGWNAGRVVGPLLAASLMPFGAQWAIVANAASFAVLWFAVAAMRRQFLPATPAWTSMRAELVSGARAMAATPGCRAAAFGIVVVNTLFVPFMGLIPATARALVDRGGGAVTDSSVASTTARLLSAQGIGAIGGTLLVASLLMRTRRSTAMAWAAAGAVVLVPLHVVLPNLATVAAAVFVLGGCATTVQSVLGGVLQRDAPPAHRGRILSWYQGMNGLSYGIGLTVMGLLGDRYGLRATFATSGLLLAVAVVVSQRVAAFSDAIDGESAAPVLAAQSSA